MPVGDAPRFDDSLTIALLRARETVTAQFRDHVGAAGLTLPQWRVIRALAVGTPLDTTTLAKRCVILAPSLSRIIKTLSDRGLIEQVPSRDKRQRVVGLARMARRSLPTCGPIEIPLCGHRGRLWSG